MLCGGGWHYGVVDDADGILGYEMTGLLEGLLERTEVTLTGYF